MSDHSRCMSPVVSSVLACALRDEINKNAGESQSLLRVLLMHGQCGPDLRALEHQAVPHSQRSLQRQRLPDNNSRESTERNREIDETERETERDTQRERDSSCTSSIQLLYSSAEYARPGEMTEGRVARVRVRRERAAMSGPRRPAIGGSRSPGADRGLSAAFPSSIFRDKNRCGIGK
jgi:hypothetical protein